ncbi:MAG: phage holin family protein [Wenzhouxiangella sp.]
MLPGSEVNSAAMESPSTAPSSSSQNETLKRIIQGIRELAHDHIELVTLETRFSINTMLKMALVTIVSAIALISGLLAMLGAAALTLIAVGLAPALAMLLVAAVNFLLAFTFWSKVRRMSHRIGWPATQRAIRPNANVGKAQPV